MLKKSFVDDLNLPANYNRTNLTLIARDPHWVFAYWEVAASSLEKIKKEINESSYVIRMHDVTCVDFNGKNSNSSFDVNIASHTNSRYINLPCDNVNYCAELGIITGKNEFIPLTKSNFISTPRLGPSTRPALSLNPPEDLPKKAKRMFLTDDDIRAYYSRIMPLNKRKAKQPATKISVKKYEETVKNNYAANIKNSNNIIFKEGLNNIFCSSPEGLESSGGASGFKGGASERGEKERKFFFEIGTELIVYGRTEPDAEVWMNDKKIDLQNDGTFSLRFALPDGKIPLDFIATSHDKVDKRTITTSVERTKTEKT